MIRGAHILLLGVVITTAGGGGFALGWRLDLAQHGALCRVSASEHEREGVERLRCTDGRRFRVVTQLPCSETLRCRLGLDCIDSLEPLY